ncbi:hypothetical protein KGF57_003388 [Candida theae]|uniref:BZIP domain-containing protein n=1 Tax=Candida theae TaxID=1198502 RepID=A0AAD5BD70_9ASCO|nr:uncharacterized protein KGF57_003388 [Candida theae]KAI5957014.1 hypothetical protein KGF57_003388 [Candida theae]
MSFHPNYYLNGLNLEYADDAAASASNNNMFSPSSNGNQDMITEEDIQKHLDLFSGAANDFYSLDVIGDNYVVPNKPIQQQQQQQQQPPRHQQQSHPHHTQPYSSETFTRPHQPSVVNSTTSQTSNSHDFTLTANTAFVQSPNSVASTPYTPSVYSSAQTSSAFVSQSPSASNSLALSQSALEDKKKRNTAASARFRIKKKLKEQEMERKAKELEEKVAQLQKRLKTMEMENKCLKSIIFQQNEQKNVDLLESIKKKSILDSKSNFEYTV